MRVPLIELHLSQVCRNAADRLMKTDPATNATQWEQLQSVPYYERVSCPLQRMAIPSYRQDLRKTRDSLSFYHFQHRWCEKVACNVGKARFSLSVRRSCVLAQLGNFSVAFWRVHTHTSSFVHSQIACDARIGRNRSKPLSYSYPYSAGTV